MAREQSAAPKNEGAESLLSKPLPTRPERGKGLEKTLQGHTSRVRLCYKLRLVQLQPRTADHARGLMRRGQPLGRNLRTQSPSSLALGASSFFDYNFALGQQSNAAFGAIWRFSADLLAL